jgi:hypothetical protein
MQMFGPRGRPAYKPAAQVKVPRQLIQQTRRYCPVYHLPQRKGRLDPRYPWQPGDLLPMHPLIILDGCGADCQVIVVAPAHQMAAQDGGALRNRTFKRLHRLLALAVEGDRDHHRRRHAQLAQIHVGAVGADGAVILQRLLPAISGAGG